MPNLIEIIDKVEEETWVIQIAIDAFEDGTSYTPKQFMRKFLTDQFGSKFPHYDVSFSNGDGRWTYHEKVVHRATGPQITIYFGPSSKEYATMFRMLF